MTPSPSALAVKSVEYDEFDRRESGVADWFWARPITFAVSMRCRSPMSLDAEGGVRGGPVGRGCVCCCCCCVAWSIRLSRLSAFRVHVCEKGLVVARKFVCREEGIREVVFATRRHDGRLIVKAYVLVVYAELAALSLLFCRYSAISKF